MGTSRYPPLRGAEKLVSQVLRKTNKLHRSYIPINTSTQRVSKVTLETLKSLRGAEDDLPVWEILNCCEEELLLTENQLHSLNLSMDDPQIPFTDLRLALESIWNIRVSGTITT